MRRAELPVSALPAWMKLNVVRFYDVRVEDFGPKGVGLVAERSLSTEDARDMPVLLKVPKDLILCGATVEEHAKVDTDFRELIDAVGGVSTRGDILLFLLMQITISSIDCPHGGGVSNPWTEYVKMLPSTVPVPTMWTDDLCQMLTGTSLEAALIAKKAALLREFERLRDATSGIAWAQRVWWENDTLDLSDWVLLDAWYRSRCLELPALGESMVPCLDLVNHATNANSFYEPTNNSDVALLLQQKQRVEVGEEITISYGPAKSAAEMLFSYGFIGEHVQSDSLVLALHPVPDDPLGRAKAAAFSGAPVARISAEGDIIQWSSPFLFLMCVNEEDGLEFKTLEQADGGQGQLQVFWQGTDVTGSTEDFQEHASQHSLRDVFALRAVALLQDRVLEQLGRIHISEGAVEAWSEGGHQVEFARTIAQLRSRESVLLEATVGLLEAQKSKLTRSPTVIKYLGCATERHDEDARQVAGD